MIHDLISYYLGSLDLSYWILRLILGPNRPRFFRLGWGSLDDAELAQKQLEESIENPSTADLLPSIERNELSRIIYNKFTTQSASFLSPFANFLPEGCKRCHFTLVEPNPEKSNDVVVLMLPATGEQWSHSRLRMAKSLVSKNNWTCAIITAPFYGERRPPTQKLHYIETVSDFLLQSLSIIRETAALGSFYISQGKYVCVTGFSWGAAMTACSSALMLLLTGKGDRIACVPYVGSATPAVLVDGILEEDIEWEILKKSPTETREETKIKLFNVLYKTQLSSLCEFIDKKKEKLTMIKSIQANAMKHDHFITPRFSQEMFDELKKMSDYNENEKKSSNIVFRWLAGGHVIAFLILHFMQKNAIELAVKALLE